MYEYYALIRPGETLATCLALARYKEGVFERYNAKEDLWKEDRELIGIYLGTPESETINKEEALKIQERLRGNYA